MRYLTLFEAFDSQKLSKTLKYIESGDKEAKAQINQVRNRGIKVEIVGPVI